MNTNHWSKRIISALIIGIISVAVGGFFITVCVNEIITGIYKQTGVVNELAASLYSVGTVLYGIWLILLGRKHNSEMLQEDLYVTEGAVAVVMGIILWILSVIFAIGTMVCVGEKTSLCMVLALSTLACKFFSGMCFQDYCHRYATQHMGRVTYSNMWGAFANLKNYMLVASLVPLVSYFYCVVFKDFINFEETSKNVSNQQHMEVWKNTHFSVWMMMCLVMLFYVLMVLGYVNIVIHPIYGRWKIFLGGVIIFSVLCAFAGRGMEFHKNRIAVYLMVAVAVAILSWGITETSFFYTVYDSKHTDIEVVDTSTSSGRAGTSYYCYVLDDNGEEIQYSIFESTYDAIEAGQAVVLCEMQGAFDIKYEYVHIK